MIRVIGIGRVKENAFRDLIEEYSKRIQPYHPLKVEEVKDESILANTSEEAIKEKEAINVLKRIQEDEYVILLDLHGKEWDSETLAQNLEKRFLTHSKICYVIAGSLGPGKALLARANERWKLSSLTFLHQMTKVIVMEQIYRAFKILAKEKYHK